MKRQLILWVLLAALLVSPALPVAHAQGVPPDQPLIILMNYDLWAYDGTSLTNVTNDGHVMEARLSPDGTKIAYENWSPLSVDAVERVGGIGGGAMPADITVLDISTLTITTIAAQPADASFFVENVADSAWLRSVPTWSPDGTHLIWGEVHYPSFAPDTNRLMVYDFGQGTTDILVTNLPEQAGVPGTVQPMWGGGGIAVPSYEYDASTSAFFVMMRFYNPDNGQQIAAVRVPENESQTFMYAVWVDANGQDEIAVQYAPAGNWDLINPQSGVIHPALAEPEMINPRVSDSAALTYTYYSDAAWPDFYSWTVMYAGGEQINSPKRISYYTRVTLGPDGQTVAQVTTDAQLSIVLPNNKVVLGPVLDDAFVSLFWGPSAWRVNQPAACGSALPPRLIVGNWGALRYDTTPNNLRTQPATGDIIGKIEPGGDFQVLAGPECANEMYWWQVDYNGTVGWTAEGDSSEYWLEPTIG